MVTMRTCALLTIIACGTGFSAAVGQEHSQTLLHELIDEVARDLGENLGLFMISEEDVPLDGDRFLRWRVNLVVDNTDVSGRPVVMETEPSYTNLFGTVERTLTQSGEAATSFMRVRAGSLMRAASVRAASA